MEKHKQMHWKPAETKFENSIKITLCMYWKCIRKQKITITLLKIQVLPATHHDCSGSLHTFAKCKKCIESTVRIGTHVKPVKFTLIIFAV